MITIIFSTAAYATSWLSIQPSVTSEHTTVDQTECIGGVNREVEVIGWNVGGTQEACVIYGSDVDVAYFAYLFPDGSNRAVHLHGGDTKFHPLRDRLDGVFIPNNDQYVYTGDPWPFETVRPLMTVQHLSSALQPSLIDNEGTVLSYQIDREKSTSWLFDAMDVNRSYDAGSFAVSANGRYVVVSVSSRGTGEYIKIDLQTKEVVALMPQFASELVLPELITQIRVKAVSNDGAYAMIGPSAILMQISECGAPFTGKFEQLKAVLSPCDAVHVSEVVSEKIGYQFETGNERFINEDSALAFMTYDVPSNKIVTKADNVILYPGEKADIKSRLHYLAMGDSYSSGEGDIEKKSDGSSFYIGDTGNDRGCHLSSRSYPYLLRDTWGVEPSKMQSVACSGAKVLPDMYGNPDNYMGQGGRLIGSTLSQREEAQANALTQFQPGMIQQLEFVKRYQPNVVTLTGGGNDIGFPEIIAYCADSYRLFGVIPTDEACAYATDAQMRADLNRLIDDQYSYNKRLIEHIQEASPTTSIYMIGYPQFVSLGEQCLNQSVLLDWVERAMIRDSVSRFNNILKMVARDTGVYYVDIEDSLEGGQICQGSEYMSGPLQLDPRKLVKGQTQEAYHPNAKGHKKIAEAIDAKIKSGMEYEIVDIPAETQGRRIIRRAVMPDYTSIGSTYTVVMGSGIVKPNGEMDTEMFSDHIQLATIVAGDDGSIRADITIPSTVGIGYHLLTLTGLDVNDEPIQIQQFIIVTEDATSQLESKIEDIRTEKNNLFDPITTDTANNILSSDEKKPLILHSNQSEKKERALVGTLHKNNPGVGWIMGILIIIGVGVIIYYEARKKRNKA